ncbi:hypothetical protein FB451DRAFT_1196367 [Mycena latifolia]|nr:hypothetical protein FB451DRAFT_1196367 [Mycena latifolia]
MSESRFERPKLWRYNCGVPSSFKPHLAYSLGLTLPDQNPGFITHDSLSASICFGQDRHGVKFSWELTRDSRERFPLVMDRPHITVPLARSLVPLYLPSLPQPVPATHLIAFSALQSHRGSGGRSPDVSSGKAIPPLGFPGNGLGPLSNNRKRLQILREPYLQIIHPGVPSVPSINSIGRNTLAGLGWGTPCGSGKAAMIPKSGQICSWGSTGGGSLFLQPTVDTGRTEFTFQGQTRANWHASRAKPSKTGLSSPNTLAHPGSIFPKFGTNKIHAPATPDILFREPPGGMVETTSPTSSMAAQCSYIDSPNDGAP